MLEFYFLVVVGAEKVSQKLLGVFWLHLRSVEFGRARQPGSAQCTCLYEEETLSAHRALSGPIY